MADDSRYSIDIPALWGPEGEGALNPAPQYYNGDEHHPVEPLPVNGAAERQEVEQQTHRDVSRLAAAIAASNSDALRRDDLDAMRAELERSFSQQLAVALYELIAACNVRFASAEEHINDRVARSVEALKNQLTVSLEANFYAAVEVSESVRSELGAVREQIAGPIEALTSLQRELRHELGRLGDLVTTQSAELTTLRQEVADLRTSMESRAPEGVSVMDL